MSASAPAPTAASIASSEVDPNGQVLFDGTSAALWEMVGRGGFHLDANQGALVADPGDDLGLLWCTVPTSPDFELTLEWLRQSVDDNSGVFVRFPNPNAKGYDNPAWVGVHFGFEVQIDEVGRPDGDPLHKTGAIYEQQGQVPGRWALPVGQWNTFVIRVVGDHYTVALNGVLVTDWTFRGPDATHPSRGLPSTPEEPRYVGLQTHTGGVSFRNVRLRAL